MENKFQQIWERSGLYRKLTHLHVLLRQTPHFYPHPVSCLIIVFHFASWCIATQFSSFFLTLCIWFLDGLQLFFLSYWSNHNIKGAASLIWTFETHSITKTTYLLILIPWGQTAGSFFRPKGLNHGWINHEAGLSHPALRLLALCPGTNTAQATRPKEEEKKRRRERLSLQSSLRLHRFLLSCVWLN